MTQTGCGVVLNQGKCAQKLLKKAYGEEFEIKEADSGWALWGYYTVLAYPKEDPDMVFTVHVNSDGKHESDNYISKKLCGEMADIMARNLDDLEGIYTVNCRPLTFSYVPEVHKSLEEYEEDNPQRIYNVYLSYAPREVTAPDMYDSISRICEGSGVSNINLYLYVTDEAGLRQINRYFNEHDTIYDDFDYKGGQYFAGVYKFEEGKPLFSKSEFEESVHSYICEDAAGQAGADM